MSLGAAFGGGGGSSGSTGKGLSMSVFETLRMAWADSDMRMRIMIVLAAFAIYALAVQVSVPIPGVNPEELTNGLQKNEIFQIINMMGGGALKRVSIVALGLNPYITASIVMQIFTQASPKLKLEMREGGEYARKKQNRTVRLLSVGLCVAQGIGILKMIAGALGTNSVLSPFIMTTTLIFWTAGALFTLWLGEQISERGVGNGVSLMIFAGIIIALPGTVQSISEDVRNGVVALWKVALLLIIFVATTWFVVLFTVAQRRIPVQHMRRTQGTKVVGGQTAYLPLSLNLPGVIPIIFAITLVFLPATIASMFGQNSPLGTFFMNLGAYTSPASNGFKCLIGSIVFTAVIFGFTYFYTAIQYNVEDIADNLKRQGSYIPGVRPGKQTSDFLDKVVSRITFVAALFLSIVALLQFLAPKLVGIARLNVLGGTTLLIIVTVALETMRQIEANILMRRYNT